MFGSDVMHLITEKDGINTLKSEPRFLENVQLYVDKAASLTDVPEDMLKYIMACDHVLRF